MKTTKYDRFEHEQQLMQCWQVTEDLNDLFIALCDEKIDTEETATILAGMKGMYELRFNKLFALFEASFKLQQK